MDLDSLIVVAPGVRSGKPCLLGTRITVDDVLGYLSSGMTLDEILTDFPELTVELVGAAIEFAVVRERRISTTS
jgi:uncharacterized protein (DUF433 family)